MFWSKAFSFSANVIQKLLYILPEKYYKELESSTNVSKKWCGKKKGMEYGSTLGRLSVTTYFEVITVTKWNCGLEKDNPVNYFLFLIPFFVDFFICSSPET